MALRQLPSLAGRNGINPAEHDGLVIKLAMMHRARHPVKDSEQYANGWLGLLAAADRYDPSFGVAFATYAVWWIRMAITRPHYLKFTNKRGNGIIKTIAASQLTREDSRRPLDNDIAIDRAPTPAAQAIDLEEMRQSGQIVWDLLRRLDQRTERFVRRVVMLGWTLEECGLAEGITRERVRQIVGRGLRKMRIAAERTGIADAIPTLELLER